jgi:predicted nucleic acid-binding protein
MKSLVVDASVAVKWFVPEIHSTAAARLLETDVVIVAPDLIGPELANTLWKKVRRGEITRAEAAEILTTFGSVGVEIHPSNVLLASALQIAVALDRTVYDSLYLALAVATDGVLITADRRFHTSVRASPLASHIRWVEDLDQTDTE